MIVDEEEGVEEALISGIAFNRDEAKLTILGVPDQPGVAHHILGPVASANIEVDMILQNVAPDGAFRFTHAPGAMPLDDKRGDHGPVPKGLVFCRSRSGAGLALRLRTTTNHRR